MPWLITINFRFEQFGGRPLNWTRAIIIMLIGRKQQLEEFDIILQLFLVFFFEDGNKLNQFLTASLPTTSANHIQRYRCFKNTHAEKRCKLYIERRA